MQRHCASALVDLALLTGNVGQRGAGLYPIRQGANEQGAWDVGCIANRLPGRGPAYNDRARAELEEILQCSLPEGRGLGVAQSLEAAQYGRIKAMLLIGDIPEMAKPDFLVVLDTFLTPAAEGADVVLPRATFAEKDGTYTNLETSHPAGAARLPVQARRRPVGPLGIGTVGPPAWGIGI